MKSCFSKIQYFQLLFWTKIKLLIIIVILLQCKCHYSVAVSVLNFETKDLVLKPHEKIKSGCQEGIGNLMWYVAPNDSWSKANEGAV